MHFHIITLFPQAIEPYLGESILGRAISDKKISVTFYNPRDFTSNPKHRIDQKPYGGGPGMVIEALPVVKAVEKAIGRKKGVGIFFFAPGGAQFTNAVADACIKKYKHIVLISGRYEGIDARVRKILKAKELSVGPYVLTGGELPAMTVVDVISRRVPGVLGDIESLEENRIAGSDVYTRPAEFVHKNRKYKVPKVLLSGDHKEINKWREKH